MTEYEELQRIQSKRYLCWSSEPTINGIEVFEVWTNPPKKDNRYCMTDVYCPTCGNTTDGLVFHNYETIHDRDVHLGGKHVYCMLCKNSYYVHEVIH